MRATRHICRPMRKMNRVTSTHDLDRLSDFFVATFPQMNRNEQVLARTIYQQLALGEPLSLGRLAGIVGQVPRTIKERLEKWGDTFYNDAGDIIGFRGISIGKKPHRIQINNIISYTWCAWDTLFIPELVGATAQVTSICTTTDKTISLTVAPQGVHSTQSDIWLSFLLPDEKSVQKNVTTSFCCFVHFFSSKAAGETWTFQNKSTFLLSLDDAFKVGKKVNAARYANVL